MRYHSKKAFTLAEVLVTLGVIGVVAALTLPSVIQNYQKKQTVASLKKMYTNLWQAAESYQGKNEVSFTNFNTSLSAKEFMQTYFNNEFKVIKECENTRECWGTRNLPKTLDNKKHISIEYGIILADGSIIAVNKAISGIVFFLDINGKKGLNRSGRDIFNFYLVNSDTKGTLEGCQAYLDSLKSGIYPRGYSGCFVPFTKYSREELLSSSIHRGCNKTGNTTSEKEGDACTTVIVMDGWEIKKDYPW